MNDKENVPLEKTSEKCIKFIKYKDKRKKSRVYSGATVIFDWKFL